MSWRDLIQPSLLFALLPKDLNIQNLFSFTAASVVSLCGRKTFSSESPLSILYFLVLWDLKFNLNHFENRVLLKPVIAGVASVAHFITGHEQTQLKRVRYFRFFDIFRSYLRIASRN